MGEKESRITKWVVVVQFTKMGKIGGEEIELFIGNVKFKRPIRNTCKWEGQFLETDLKLTDMKWHLRP